MKVYIIDAKRTAIGKFLGSLYETDPVMVSKQVIDNLFEKNNVKKEDVEKVIIGNVISAGMGQGVARHIAIESGIPECVPAYSLNMVCGSGMQAIINGFMEIKTGSSLVLCGGVEFMSNIPYATNSYIRLGKKFGDFTMTDLMVKDGLTDSMNGVHMGITAENIAKKLNISRDSQDNYAFMSIQRAISAVDSGKFKDEIVSLTLKDYKGNEYIFDTDEYPNRATSLEKMRKLKPTFLKDGTGTITAGNSSGINDGAAYMLLASEEYCVKNNIKPLAEICDGVTIGCDPLYMGLGPYFAIEKLLNKSDILFDAIDYFEINEAFAAQVLGCFHMLSEKYDISVEDIVKKTNIWGSGLGLGHPLGATGTRITSTLAHIMKAYKAKYGIASLCIGGGQGIALLLKGGINNELT